MKSQTNLVRRGRVFYFRARIPEDLRDSFGGRTERNSSLRTSDEEWLAVAGREAWVVLTRDKHIRRRPTELEAFRERNVIVFVLAAGNASAAETADLVPRLYDTVQRLAAQANPPVMYRVTRSGVSKAIKFK